MVYLYECPEPYLATNTIPVPYELRISDMNRLHPSDCTFMIQVVSGKKYRFAQPVNRQNIDPRDVPAILSIPSLKKFG
jgi:hypothetical protein